MEEIKYKSPEELGISQEQFDNLKKLSDYLTKRDLKACFDMCRFSDSSGFLFATTSELVCGTIGCAVGHGPYEGIVKKDTESWMQYCQRSLGVKECSLCLLFYFLFSHHWKERDNTPEGAGKRIEYFLKNGLPPNIREQLIGLAPLCYV